MRSESEVLFEDNPFTIPVADRVRRLPPYLFGTINKRKYQLRVAGVDVIDLGMGNPTDPPDPLIIKKIEESGCVFIRHGGRHDWYQNPATKMAQPVPRHREINERLAHHILKMLSRGKEK